MQSLLDLLTYGSSHHHDIHPRTPMLIIQSLQWKSLDADIIPPRPRGSPHEGPPFSPLDAPCRSYTTTRALQQTSVAINAQGSFHLRLYLLSEVVSSSSSLCHLDNYIQVLLFWSSTWGCLTVPSTVGTPQLDI